MKKRLAVTLYFLALLPVAYAGAAETLKLGFVDTAYILKKAPQADAARKKLEKEFAPREEQVVTMQRQLKAVEENISKNALTLSEAERKSQEREILSLQRDIKRAKEEFNEDLNLRRNDELGKLQKVVFEAIVRVANKENFDLILGDSVLFANKRVNVTELILKQLKADYDISATETKTNKD
ncbi:MAG: OmpH family outer membrane protein [Gammaproteobacteria bacterium]